MRRWALILALATAACAELAPVAAPAAMEAGRLLTKLFAGYVKEKLGRELTQVNCEIEDHPETGEVLAMCTGKYNP